MAYAIFLTKKLKTGGQIAGSASHVQRDRETPNANPYKENVWLMGNPEQDLVQDTFNHIGNQTIRKNAVLCVELVLSASPEFFRPSTQTEPGEYEQLQLNRWLDFNKQWLQERFNVTPEGISVPHNRIISAAAHLDEVTPHIHAHMVPIDKRGKLNASAFFGSPKLLREWQDDYAQAMKPLGLERGIRGSKATHIDIGRYYTNINSPQTDNIEVLRDKARDRDRAERQRREIEATALAKQKEADELRRQNQQLQLQIQIQKKKLEELSKSPYDISLEDVAYQLGFERDKNKPLLWLSTDRLLMINDNKFATKSASSNSEETGENPIDLVQTVLDVEQRESIGWLADNFGSDVAIANFMKKIKPEILQYPTPKFQPPSSSEQKWQQAKSYLTNTYGISDKVLETEHSHNRIYADNQGNAVIKHYLIAPSREHLKQGTVVTGASIVGEKFNGVALGSSRTEGWFGIGFDEGKLHQVALADSPIEVFSLASLNPKPKKPTVFLTANGSISESQIHLLQRIQSNGGEIILAYSATSSGEKLVKQVSEQLQETRRVKPQAGETWNDDLRLLREQLQQERERLQQKQKSVKRGIELD
ncbi:plasmid recombination protein [Plectonema cf. radiosum LEGE 06105]|uniref:Plasmid recombination protein n=1 Tax=Plectonema cf. radiosum LEGE 06105 TaxID=945769 RepID=A0A8J7K258_9CYAN|nr:MobV family relaxase [Plectonema radiosum]MBE9213682.1 plasmid recombination protein [Plectonema cf. radiosum LEGE 06105]